MIRHRATPSRRTFLQTGAAVLIGAEFGAGGIVASAIAQTAARSSPPLASVKALVFDTFGTTVDWRTSVSKEVEAFAKRKRLTVDGAKFADAWRAAYRPSLDRVRAGAQPWTTLDRLHRMSLDKLLIDFGITGLSEAETDALNRAWHRLQPCPTPWPGSRA